MGRRALRKIDPDLDLSDWLLSEERLPEMLSADSIFGRPGALEIEVGTGKGLFLAQATRALPDHFFLGIEIAHKYARFAAAGLAKRQCVNGKVILGDGMRLFRERLSDETIAAVHVYFPDPWWKKRHRRRRVMQESFLRGVQRVLLPHGKLHFWTDVEEYYVTTLELIRQTTDLHGPTVPGEAPTEHDLDYRTHFERRMRLSGQTVYRSVFCKA